MIDILVHSQRDRHAAARFVRTLVKRPGREPRPLITDTLRRYSAAHRTVLPSVVHSTQPDANTRAEVSQYPTRQREPHMRRGKSARHVPRFLSVHGRVRTLWRVRRHLRRAPHHRVLRPRAFCVWDEVTCAYCGMKNPAIERALCALIVTLTVPAGRAGGGI